LNRLQQVRADMALEWLDSHPEGGNAKDVREALPMCTLSTVQKLMGMLRAEGMVFCMGAGPHLRYAAPRHAKFAQAHARLLVEQATIKRREMAAQRASEAQGLVHRNHGTSVEVKHQPVVREWPKLKKLGPRSVFELAGA